MKRKMDLKKRRWIPKTKKGKITAGAAAGVAGLLLMSLPFLPPKYGREALEEGQSIVLQEAVSKADLSERLCSSWSEDASEYALKHLDDVSWEEEALEAFDEINAKKDLSKKAIRSGLEDRQFTDDEIDYAFEKESCDFRESALRAAGDYVENQNGEVGRSLLRTRLEGKQFEPEEISYALNSDKIDWNEPAVQTAKLLLANPLSEPDFRDQMSQLEFRDDEISHSVSVLKPDWKANCRSLLHSLDNEGSFSKTGLISEAVSRKFPREIVESLAGTLKSDWKYNCVRHARKLIADGQTDSAALKSALKTAGFEDDQIGFAFGYYDENRQSMDDVETIKSKIAKEEERKRKEEEERARKAEEEARKAEEAALAWQKEQEAAQQAQAAVPQGEMVWICSTGECYHRHSTCSRMNSPWQVTIDEAVAYGRRPCKKCY